MSNRASSRLSVRMTRKRAVAYLVSDNRIKACYRQKNGSYVYVGCVERFEDMGYWLEGDDMDFIEERPVVLPEKIEIKY